MTMEGTGIVPVMDMNCNRGYGYGDGFGYGGGMWFMWIIVLFALMGGWGNGFGRNGWGNGPGLTQVEMQQGFDTQSILRKLDGINNGLCDGFYAQNATMLNGFNAVLVKGCGIYSIFVDLNIVPTAEGDITVQLLNNGEIIPSAQATILAVAGNSYHISISTLLRVLKSCPCVIDNTASLQAQVTGAATVNNVNIIVIREA